MPTAALSGLVPSAASLPPWTVQTALLAVLLWLAASFFSLRRQVLSKTLRLFGWAAASLALWLCWQGFEGNPGVSAFAVKATVVGFGLALWRLAGVGLDLFYGENLFRRQGKQLVSKITLDLARFALLVALILVGLGTVFEVNLGALLTSSAILTALIGLSLQDVIGSLFSGLLIQMERPFLIGDWIKTGEHEGQVTEITWRYTVLTTFHRDRILLPNNLVAKERLTNFSRPGRDVRQIIDLPAPLSVPPVKVKAALEHALKRCDLVVTEPEPTVRLRDIDSSRQLYRLVFSTTRYENLTSARSEVLSAVWYELRKQGIEIPMDRRAVYRDKDFSCETPASLFDLARGFELFSSLHADELELLLSCSAIRHFAAGAHVVRQGDRGSSLFMIVAGEVSVRAGGQEITRLGSGQFFGEMALLTGEPRKADVVAAEAVTCLEVEREAFRAVLDKNGGLVAAVKDMFVTRSRENEARRTVGEDLPSAQTMYERFIQFFGL